MIKIIFSHFRRPLTCRISTSFSSYADPYYILGVEKNAPFPQIKKAFYKLANEFHPDKNDTQLAQQKFVVIKQAFESIKMEKGLMKPQDLYRSQDRESMRPNPEKYQTEQAQNVRNFRDYTVFSEKMQSNSDYTVFNNSFNTINNINDIKIKVQEGEMKDPTKRFNLDQYKGRNSSYSESGNKYFFVIMTGLTIFTIMANQVFSEKEVVEKQNALKRLANIHKRKTIQSDLIENKRIDLRNMERSQDIIELKNELILEDIKNNRDIKYVKDKVISPERNNSV